MRITISSIADRGIANKERLVLKVNSDINLEMFLVAVTRYVTSSKVLNTPAHIMWLPTIDVKKGDQVIIYSREGHQSTAIRKDGFKNHFLYWGLKQTVWNSPDSCAVLFEVNEWNASLPG